MRAGAPQAVSTAWRTATATHPVRENSSDS